MSTHTPGPVNNGVHFNVSRADYDLIDRVNWSTLKMIERSPAHYRHLITTKVSYDSDEMVLGRAFHLAAIEPERFANACIVWPGKVRNGKKWDAFSWENCDREILTKAIHAKALALGNAIRSSAMAAPYIAGGKGEVTVLWTHEVPAIASVPGYQIDCKCRLDLVASVGALADFKSAKDGQPDAFGRTIVNLGYDAQAAMQVDAYKAATGKVLPYVWPVVETSAPHVVQVYRASEVVLERGRARYRGLLDRLSVCREESRWPGYADSLMDAELPRWALPDDDEISEEAA